MGMIAVICQQQTKAVRSWLDGDDDEDLDDLADRMFCDCGCRQRRTGDHSQRMETVRDEDLQAMQRLWQPDDYKARQAHVDHMLKMYFRRELSKARKMARGAREK